MDVILTREDAPELNNYFHGDFLSADPALTAAFDGSSPYVNYNITGFEHELTIESLWACRGTTMHLHGGGARAVHYRHG